MPDPQSTKVLTVRICRCGIRWAGGNTKYCPAGHAYEFEEATYFPASETVPRAVAEGLRDTLQQIKDACTERKIDTYLGVVIVTNGIGVVAQAALKTYREAVPDG